MRPYLYTFITTRISKRLSFRCLTSIIASCARFLDTNFFINFQAACLNDRNLEKLCFCSLLMIGLCTRCLLVWQESFIWWAMSARGLSWAEMWDSGLTPSSSPGTSHHGHPSVSDSLRPRIRISRDRGKIGKYSDGNLLIYETCLSLRKHVK